MGVPLTADLDPQLHAPQVGAGLKQVEPFIKGGMGLGLAGEKKMETVEERAPTEGLMGVKVVAQQGDGAAEIAGGVLFQPALGGGDFAILLGVAVLRGDKLGPQRDDLRLAGRHDHRRGGTVKVSDLAALVFEVGTTRTMNLLRGM